MATPKNDLYIVREFQEADKNFIFATLLRGLYYGNSFFSDVPKDIFMGNYHRIIEGILENPATVVRVACLKDDSEVILGYSIARQAGDQSVLDYVFVKPAWRKIGIAKNLMPPNIFAVSHLTKQGHSMLKAKLPGVMFNPFLIM